MCLHLKWPSTLLFAYANQPRFLGALVPLWFNTLHSWTDHAFSLAVACYNKSLKWKVLPVTGNISMNHENVWKYRHRSVNLDNYKRIVGHSADMFRTGQINSWLPTMSVFWTSLIEYEHNYQCGKTIMGMGSCPFMFAWTCRTSELEGRVATHGSFPPPLQWVSVAQLLERSQPPHWPASKPLLSWLHMLGQFSEVPQELAVLWDLSRTLNCLTASPYPHCPICITAVAFLLLAGLAAGECARDRALKGQ